MRKERIPFILNGTLFVVTLFLSLITDWNPPRWKDFNDPADYLQQSKIPLSSREFYAPHQQGTFFPRAFTVPLFYKLAGSKPEVIIQILWRLPEQVFPRLQSGLSTLMELTKLGIRREQLWRNTQGLIYFICLKRIILYDEKTCYTSPTTGMFIVNLVPFPSLLFIFISPLCFFTIS